MNKFFLCAALGLVLAASVISGKKTPDCESISKGKKCKKLGCDWERKSPTSKHKSCGGTPTESGSSDVDEKPVCSKFNNAAKRCKRKNGCEWSKNVDATFKSCNAAPEQAAEPAPLPVCPTGDWCVDDSVDNVINAQAVDSVTGDPVTLLTTAGTKITFTNATSMSLTTTTEILDDKDVEQLKKLLTDSFEQEFPQSGRNRRGSVDVLSASASASTIVCAAEEYTCTDGVLEFTSNDGCAGTLFNQITDALGAKDGLPISDLIKFQYFGNTSTIVQLDTFAHRAAAYAAAAAAAAAAYVPEFEWTQFSGCCRGPPTQAPTACTCNGKLNAQGEGGKDCQSEFNSDGKKFCYTDVNACQDGTLMPKTPPNSEVSFAVCTQATTEGKRLNHHDTATVSTITTANATLATETCAENCARDTNCTAYELEKRKRKNGKPQTFKCETHIATIDSASRRTKTCKTAQCYIKGDPVVSGVDDQVTGLRCRRDPSACSTQRVPTDEEIAASRERELEAKALSAVSAWIPKFKLVPCKEKSE